MTRFYMYMDTCCGSKYVPVSINVISSSHDDDEGNIVCSFTRFLVAIGPRTFRLILIDVTFTMFSLLLTHISCDFPYFQH